MVPLITLYFVKEIWKRSSDPFHARSQPRPIPTITSDILTYASKTDKHTSTVMALSL